MIMMRSNKIYNIKFDRTFFLHSQKKVRSFWDLTKLKILNSIVLFFVNHKKSTIILGAYKNNLFYSIIPFFDKRKVRSFWELSKVKLYSIVPFLTITKKVRSFWDLTRIKFLYSIVLFFDSQKKVRSFCRSYIFLSVKNKSTIILRSYKN
jgi:hypothetical protein